MRPSGDERALGGQIKRARKASGLSLQDVASRCDMSKIHIWELERGIARNPTVSTLARLAVALGVPYLRLCKAALTTVTRSLAVRKGD